MWEHSDRGEQSQVKRRLIKSSRLIKYSCFIQIHKFDSLQHYPIKECTAALSLNSNDPLGFLMIWAAQEQLNTMIRQGTPRTSVLRKNNHLSPVFCIPIYYMKNFHKIYIYIASFIIDIQEKILVYEKLRRLACHLWMWAVFLEVSSWCMLHAKLYER